MYVDVTPEKFIETISADGVDIVAFSMLLTAIIPSVNSAIESI